MRIRQLLYRLQRPALWLASIGVMVAVFAVEPAPSAAPITVALPSPTPEPVPLFTPTEMEIPKIELKAPVIPVGTKGDGTMGTPSNAVDVAWWDGEKAGGDNALFAAHRDWSGRLGSFYRLKELVVGDDVVVRGKRAELRYKVVWVKQVNFNVQAEEFLGPQGEPRVITLITCAGVYDRSIGTSRERFVARAALQT